MKPDFYKLMLVTHREHSALPTYLDFIKQCVLGGVTSVQLREKNTDPVLKLQLARALKNLLAPYQIPLIINDDLELAFESQADGVHLGQSDCSPEKARALLGPDKIIGISIEEESQLHTANQTDVNYVAASAVFPSDHKKNLQTIWGLSGVNKLASLSKHPLIGIGGINQDNLVQVIQSGAQGIAVIGALHQAENPTMMAGTLRQIIDSEIK